MTIRSSDDIVAAAQSKISSITVSELQDALQKSSVELIDVREGLELQTKGAIPGSHHASRGMLEFYIDPQSAFHLDAFHSEKMLVFVCGSGGRASLAAQTAFEMGLLNIKFLQGGISAWIEAGSTVIDVTK